MSSTQAIKTIDISYHINNSKDSVSEIVYALHPEWRDDGVALELKTFTQGVTNNMLKVDHADTSLVVRAFGPGAAPLTSRPREIETHGMFAEYGLAPVLLARFNNGLVYHFDPGEPCSTETLPEERVWRGVARTLGRWHAVLPLGAEGSKLDAGEMSTKVPREGQGGGTKTGKEVVKEIQKEQAPGDVWAVLRAWADRIPDEAWNGKDIRNQMKEEVEWAFEKLGGKEGLGGQKLVMGHCDLLAGNILIQSPKENAGKAQVQFIDYEFSVACHAAFDIALHFGEWPGFDCDYTRIPSPETRHEFLKEYVNSWRLSRAKAAKRETTLAEDDVKVMDELVDEFRGLPGLWFGLWGLVQAHESSEEFDYRHYAKLRLSEYWTWKGVEPSLGFGEGNSNAHLREDRWSALDLSDRKSRTSV